MLNRPSKAAVTRVVGTVGALVALSAFLMLSTSAPDPAFAQVPPDPITIDYKEIIVPDPQGDDFPPVGTFKSQDPEGAGIYWDVTGTDADDFEISRTGVLTFKAPPDYENPTDRPHAKDLNSDDDTNDTGEMDDAANRMYKITIRATEMTPPIYMGRALSTETDITVSVTNVDEPGVVTLQWLGPEVGTPIRATLTDPDGGISNDNVEFIWWVDKVSGLPDPTFDGHWSSINLNQDDKENVGETTGVPVTMYTPRGKRAADVTPPPGNNVAADEGKFLRVVATYYDTEQSANDPDTAGDDKKKAYGVSVHLIRAEQTTGETDSENGSPDFNPTEVSREVSEAAAVGTDVGAPVTALDPNSADPKDELTYELDSDLMLNNPIPEADDSTYFDIHPATGQITVAKTLDYDERPSEASPDGKYFVIVRATDPSGEKTEATVTITATRANDRPKISGASELRVNEADSDDHDNDGDPEYTPLSGAGAVTGTSPNVYKASDDDAIDQVTWSLAGDDAALFLLNKVSGPDEPREIKFKETPDFENPMDRNRDSVYEVTLVATDDGDLVGGSRQNKLMDEKHVSIFVDNVQEVGKATLWKGTEALGMSSPVIGKEVTALVDDPDEGVTIVTWQWSSSENGSGPYAAMVGATSASYTPMGDDSGKYLRVTATYTDTMSGRDDLTEGSENLDERVQNVTGTSTNRSGTAKDPKEVIAELRYERAGDGTVMEHKLYHDEGLNMVMVTSGNAVREEAPPDDGEDDQEPEEGQINPISCPTGSIVREVAENAESGTFVGTPLDKCTGGKGPLTYDLLPAARDNRNFSITIPDADGTPLVEGVGSPVSPGFPQLSVGEVTQTGSEDKDPNLDYEDDSEYTVTVRVEDAADPQNTGSFTVTVRLTDLNEMPMFDEASRGKTALDFDENHTDQNPNNEVATYVATDPDNKRISWYVTGPDAGDFAISQAGVLSFKNAPDHETPTDRDYDANRNGDPTDEGEFTGKDNNYQITVWATEAMAVGAEPGKSAKSAKMDVTVTVTDKDEPGKVTLKWLQPEVGTPISAEVTDPDGKVTIVSHAWYRSKVTTPNFNPDPETLTTEWVQIDGQSGASYVPQGVDNGQDPPTGTKTDEDKYLLVLASYAVGSDTDNKAVGISRYPVRADVADAANGSPDFTRNVRDISIPESTLVDGVVGIVVVDMEPNNDTLTYELVPVGTIDNTGQCTGINCGDVKFFKIDPATAQITLKKMLSYEADDDRTGGVTAGEYKFIVRATDPSGEPSEIVGNIEIHRDRDDITVTVTATQMNEAPKVTYGFAELSLDEADSTKKPEDLDYFVDLGYVFSDAIVVLRKNNPNLYKVDDPDGDENPFWILDGDDMGHFGLATPEDGVGRRLRFVQDFYPNFEDPQDDNRDNVYEVTVVVSDGDVEGRMSVRVEVMNKRETGELVLTPAQPCVVHEGCPAGTGTITATVTDDDGIESYTYWKWARTDTNIDAFGDGGSLEGNAKLIEGATMSTYEPGSDDVGKFLHAYVEYRDGWSVEDKPATTYDERNEAAGEDQILGTDDDLSRQANATRPTATDRDSDEMLRAGTDNAVQTAPVTPEDPGTGDPTGPTGPTPPTMSSFRTQVAENTPGSGYVKEPVELMGGLTYELGGTDADRFELADSLIDVYAGNLHMRPGQIAMGMTPVEDLNFESDQGTYEVTLTGTDGDGQRDIITVEISVVDVNEAPSVPEELPSGLEITGRDSVNREEGDSVMVASYRLVGAEAGRATWAPLEGADKDLFDFTGGVLTLRAAPDFEMPADMGADNLYQVRLKATAPGDPGHTARKEVVIVIGNADEDGTITFSSEPPAVRVAIMATLKDSDGGVENIKWQWQMSDMADGTYANIDMATEASYTPKEAVMDDESTADTDESDSGDVGKFLRVMATYTDAHGAGKEATQMAMGAVTEDLTFAAMIVRTLPENSAEGTPVGDTVEATGGLGSTLAYTLSGTDAPSFDIDNMGQITVGTGTDLDHETKDTYTVMVTARGTADDGTAEVAMTTVTIEVTDVDETGMVTLSTDRPMVDMATITATLSDEDYDAAEDGAVAWQWASSAATTGTWTAITDATSDAYTPVMADDSMYLQATATYDDGVPGEANDADDTAMAVTANAVGSTTPMTGGVLATYDADNSADIQKPEYLEALTDYILDNIDKDTYLEVLALYIASP